MLAGTPTHSSPKNEDNKQGHQALESLEQLKATAFQLKFKKNFSGTPGPGLDTLTQFEHANCSAEEWSTL